MQIEICVETLNSALAAQQGQAHRVELCSALCVGGITPSSGLIRAARAELSIQLFVMIRPREGNFVYNEHEFRIMKDDVVLARELGCDGVVLGLLTPQGTIDVERTRALVELAAPMQVTFHRAFDEVQDEVQALEDVIRTGAHRILSSGGAASAVEGIARLARLQQQAGPRISLMAGGGVRQTNAVEILQGSGVQEVHSSLLDFAEEPHAQDWPSVQVEDVKVLKEICESADAALQSLRIA